MSTINPQGVCHRTDRMVLSGTRDILLQGLSEARNMDGQRSFWSPGPSRHPCNGEHVAALCTLDFSAFLFLQSCSLLVFLSNVISDCAEIIIVIKQEIFNANSVSVFQVIWSPLQSILVFLLFPFGNLLIPARYWKPLKLFRKILGNFNFLHRKRIEVCHSLPQGASSPSSGGVPHQVSRQGVGSLTRDA